VFFVSLWFKLSAMKNWLLPIILLVTFLCFFNSLSGDYVFDDLSMIAGNPTIGDWSSNNLRFIFTHDLYTLADKGSQSDQVDSLYYRPLYRVFLMSAHLVAGGKTYYWHLINLLLHLLVTGLVFGIVEKTAGFFPALAEKRYQIAALASLIFAIHPAQSESVAWITGANTTVCNLFMLLAFYLHLEYRVGQSRRFSLLMISVFSFALGLLVKESAIILPVLIVGYYILVFSTEESLWTHLRRGILSVIPYLIIIVPFLMMRLYVFGSFGVGSSKIRELVLENNPEIGSLTMEITLFTLPKILFGYIKILLFPYNIPTFHNSGYIYSPDFVNFWLPLITVTACFGLALFAFRKIEMFGVGLLWLVVPLLPMLNMGVFPDDQLVQSRYMYVSIIGFGIIIAVLFERLARSSALRIPLFAAAAIILPLAFYSTFRQNGLFKDNLHFFSRAVEWAPYSKTARVSLGMAYEHMSRQETGEIRIHYLEQAATNYEQAIVASPRMVNAINNLSFVYWELGKRQEATKVFERMVEVRPRKGLAHANLAFVYEAQGREEEALREYELALAADPQNKLAARWQERIEVLKNHKDTKTQRE
jgi:protein O-mannosyl-transferase